MHPLAPRQARGLSCFRPRSGRGVFRVRVALRLGFFVFWAFAGCADVSPDALAASADAAHHTGVFSWLVTHRPATLVVWQASLREVAPVVPGSDVRLAGKRPCAEAKAGHAELLLLAAEGTPERDAAHDCGFAVFGDAGALVIAPL